MFIIVLNLSFDVLFIYILNFIFSVIILVIFCYKLSRNFFNIKICLIEIRALYKVNFKSSIVKTAIENKYFLKDKVIAVRIMITGMRRKSKQAN